MRKYVLILLASFFSFNEAYAKAIITVNAQSDSLWVLDDIPDWIQKNIKFPQEAYKYGMAGIEQFVISATWEGRVFITSGLKALNPAFEKEIKDVVSRAPRCRFAGASIENIYKVVKIDFSDHIAGELRENMQCVKRYLPPSFALRGEKIQMLRGRECFVEWVSSKYNLPRGINMKNYTDTVTFNYTITNEGKVENVWVGDCKNSLLQLELERVMKKSRSWHPAITESKALIAVSISDKVILKTNENGVKIPLKIHADEVCCNSVTTPVDPNMIVLNPEVQPQYAGNYKNFMSVIYDSLIVEKRIKFAGSFVIETDGTTTNIYTEVTDAAADSIITALIKQSHWIPALQGGDKVRTLYTFIGKKLPPAKYVYGVLQNELDFVSGRQLPPARYIYEYDDSPKARWRYFKKAYPTISYDEFNNLRGEQYYQALMMRGFHTFEVKKRVVRK